MLLSHINRFLTYVSDYNVCKFGSLIMQHGDTLNSATDYSSVCVKCVCEVGPTPTCQRLPDDECDVTKEVINRMKEIRSSIQERIG